MLELTIWAVLALLHIGGLTVAALATLPRFRRLAALPLIPIGLDVLIVASGGLASSWLTLLPTIVTLCTVLIGVIAGGPLAALALRLSTRSTAGTHGGIMVLREHEPQEVLRGGTAIGYLERAGLIGAIAVGHPEAIAAIIAIKGLGRYSELRESEVRERFIIGTLVSLIWAAACGAVATLGLAAG